ncbi:hypothetical protein G6F53_003017 [Rhizopus delemar]|nr:hypothetical protein G6F53_003017 [Rhizopus delemar]
MSNPATPGNNPIQPSSSSSAPTPRPEIQATANREKTMAEFLSLMDNYAPIIPDAVTDYYLSKSGFDCDDVRIGHGGRVADTSNDEDDGYDETIYPLDFDKFDGTSGQILDDEMHEIMVKPLPKGCRLTAIFDSCHSGTVLDLPYIYSTKGIIKENNVFKQAGMGFLSAGIKYASGDREGALSSILSLGKEIMESRQVSDEVRERNTSLADVIMFSGCKDDQTSADAKEAGRATGAMSYALTTTLREDPNQSYYKLLNNIRRILRDKYSQRPQLSASHPIDVYLEFKC